MKKLFCVALSLILAFAFAGCEQKGTEKTVAERKINTDVEANYTVIALEKSLTDGIEDKLVSPWKEERIIDEGKKGTAVTDDIYGKTLDFTYKNSFIPLYDWEYVDVYENENGKSIFVKNGKTVGFEDNSKEFADRQITLDTPEKLKSSDDTDPLYFYQQSARYFKEDAKNAINKLGVEDIRGYSLSDIFDCFNVSDFYNDGETVIRKYKFSFTRNLYDGVTNGWYDSNDRYVVTVTEKGGIYSVYAANIGSFDGYEIDGIKAVPLFNNNIADFKLKVYGEEYRESNKIVTKIPDGKCVLCETVDVYKGLHTGTYIIITPIE